MESCSPCNVPVQKGDKLFKSECPQNDKETYEMERVTYASAVGSLMYAQVFTRPIAYAVNVLGRHLSSPYCPDDRKSTSGLIFMMAGGAISWKSVKQTLMSTLTMETKYVAYYEVTYQAM
ncbi:secreted RxLR effector protein 161-like [Lathyrus oleraceus]|uniref:secreted RxLR effector protein 161-like n=1 Tax=Pisum sativum TaxID=3888 RepID=UPI0021D2904A|nr:secreted RxLR effector protein 161-like [Pisum sativum]